MDDIQSLPSQCDAVASCLTHLEFTEEYVWDNVNKVWIHRKAAENIGRCYFVIQKILTNKNYDFCFRMLIVLFQKHLKAFAEDCIGKI